MFPPLLFRVYFCRHFQSTSVNNRCQYLCSYFSYKFTYKILEILWSAGRALNANEIRDALNQSRKWERTTVLTFINRLLKKGVIAQEKREVYYSKLRLSYFIPVPVQLPLPRRLYGDRFWWFLYNHLYGSHISDHTHLLLTGCWRKALSRRRNGKCIITRPASNGRAVKALS